MRIHALRIPFLILFVMLITSCAGGTSGTGLVTRVQFSGSLLAADGNPLSADVSAETDTGNHTTESSAAGEFSIEVTMEEDNFIDWTFSGAGFIWKLPMPDVPAEAVRATLVVQGAPGEETPQAETHFFNENGDSL